MTESEAPQQVPTVTPQVAQEIAKVVGDSNVTAEQVNSVLAAWQHVQQGEPVGTVRRDPTTGAVGHRIDIGGVQQWHVSQPNGEIYNDLQPSLPWPMMVYPDAVGSDTTE